MPVFFEDVAVGDSAEFGRHRVTEEAVVDFAERYDPQWFHTDPERAADSTFGGLVASGWHTAAMTMRMLVDEYLDDLATLGAKGVDELRWTRPVRPGDVLSVRTEVVEKVPETPERGTVGVRVETVADGETVMRYVALVMVARDDAE
jgi:acyl dehydratase